MGARETLSLHCQVLCKPFSCIARYVKLIDWALFPFVARYTCNPFLYIARYYAIPFLRCQVGKVAKMFVFGTPIPCTDIDQVGFLPSSSAFPDIQYLTAEPKTLAKSSLLTTLCMR